MKDKSKLRSMLIIMGLVAIVMTAMLLNVEDVPGLGVVALAGALTKLAEKD